MVRRLVVLCALVAAVAAPAASRGVEQAEGYGLEPVALVPFEDGSHLELSTIGGRDYAFVTTAVRSDSDVELRVIDVTSPEKPRVVARLGCGDFQGNVQISHDRKTLILGIDAPADAGSCFPPGEMGFLTIDIRNPRKPRPIGYALNENGSHSTAAHPTKPFVYNGEGFPDAPGRVQIWSIENPAKPELVGTFDTGEHSAHDLSFSRDGKMAALASVTSLKLLDTTDPADPKIEFVTQCPGCIHTHEARFTPDGKRLVVNDEFVSDPSACPGAALYFYDVVDLPSGHGLQLTGEYYPEDLVVNGNDEVTFCTSHVFGISPDGTKLAAAWHGAGVRYLDISEATGVTVGKQGTPGGVRELGSYLADGGDTFSAKMHRGPYVYSVDSNRGFEVLRVGR
ncbi:MAG: hypothetical protein M3271_05545 [Actinomycetota bacterium]|nr:hypothetical protein [Actinomycetota bacterium]